MLQSHKLWKEWISYCRIAFRQQVIPIQLIVSSSFIGHDGLAQQKKLVRHMREAQIKLFAPSDLALPYTTEERVDVQVPREKQELENELERAGVPFVTICIGNFTSFALDSP